MYSKRHEKHFLGRIIQLTEYLYWILTSLEPNRDKFCIEKCQFTSPNSVIIIIAKTVQKVALDLRLNATKVILYKSCGEIYIMGVFMW